MTCFHFSLSHNTLANYYTTIFALAQHHKWSVAEIENLVPYERDLYVHMLMEHLEKLKLEAEQKAAAQQSSRGRRRY